jgi:isoquinoline 1-oxidoreductase alpha subunit
MTALTVNQKKHEIDVDPTTPLLWVLREKLQLTGTKFGCGTRLHQSHRNTITRFMVSR